MDSRRIAIGMASLLLFGVGLRAEEELFRIPLVEKDIPAPRVTWFGIYMNGTKVGFLREEFGRESKAADAAWFLDQTGTVRLESMGQTVSMDISERQEFDAAAPFAFRGGWTRMTQEGGGAQEVRITRGESGLTAEVAAGGDTRTLPVPDVDYTLADIVASELWIQQGPAVGDAKHVRTFQMSDIEADTTALTVLSRKESLVQGVRTVFYEVRQVQGSTGEEGVARLDARGQVLSIVFGGLFEGRVEPEDVAKRIEESSDLFVFGMAPIDKPIGPPHRVKRLVLKADGEGAAKLLEAPGQAVARDGDEVTLTLGDGAGSEDEASAEETRKALMETVDYPCAMPEVKALAAEAVGEADAPREKVALLVRFVSEYIEGMEAPGPVSVAEILASRRGDCTEYSALFVTLARAAGVPAREVSGLMYMGDDVLAFGGHAWAEVALDGRWVPVDPTWDQTEVDATHITLDREGVAMGSLTTLGRLRFRLVSVETAPGDDAGGE